MGDYKIIYILLHKYCFVKLQLIINGNKMNYIGTLFVYNDNNNNNVREQKT